MGIRSINEWRRLDPNDVCICCGHKRKDHTEFEDSCGNDSHECEKTIKVKGTIYNCSCGRFEK